MRVGLGADPTFTATGVANDPDSFAAFVAANQGYADQIAAYNAANQGDAILRQVAYNPVTGVVGPLPLSYGSPSIAPTAPGATNTGVPSYVWVLGIGVLAAVMMASGKGRR